MRLVLVLFAAAAIVSAQPALAPKGSVERVKVHGKSLEGNLAGDPADRDVAIYLPPGYARNPARRFPVVYFLHGFTDSDDKWFGLGVKHWINLPETLDRAWTANPGSREAIIVMPNAFTLFSGSMYSSSATTGDWETFITRELIDWVDAHYRTIARPASRGLAGHSMGGYGTLRIGLKHPGAFAAIYALSPCCLAPAAPAGARSEEIQKKLAAIETRDQLMKADFMTKAMFASAAAWSPNPQRPPFFVDLPWKDGELQPAILAKWQANAPLVALDQYVAAAKSLRGIAIDSGDKDMGIAPAVRAMHAVFDSYKVPHDFEIYEGDHLNRIAHRIETKVVPFFSQHLDFGPKP